VDYGLHDRAMALLNQRSDKVWSLLNQPSDKVWSLCDAVSFVVMNERGIGEALTTDHNFEQAGFVRLLAG